MEQMNSEYRIKSYFWIPISNVRNSDFNKPLIWGVGGNDCGYKNNNGNYSLGLVPIHRLQPRSFTMSDYCYSDWLHRGYETLFSNPKRSGSACYSRTFRLSFLPVSRQAFRDEVSFRLWYLFPEGYCISFR